jgi:hypothetical protein
VDLVFGVVGMLRAFESIRMCISSLFRRLHSAIHEPPILPWRMSFFCLEYLVQ